MRGYRANTQKRCGRITSPAIPGEAGDNETDHEAACWTPPDWPRSAPALTSILQLIASFEVMEMFEVNHPVMLKHSNDYTGVYP